MATLDTHRRGRRREHRSAMTRVGLATLVAAGLYLTLGEYWVPIGDLVPALRDELGTESHVLRNLRLPRLVIALCAGASFGAAGALLQSLARNPLASPDIIGINAGASAAGVVAIVVWRGTSATVSLAAAVGALGVALLVNLFGRRGGLSVERMVLAGVALGALATAVTSYLWARASMFEAQRANAWLTGSLVGRDWDEARVSALAALALLPAAALVARPLSTLFVVGDEASAAIGVGVNRLRTRVLVVAACLAAGATATTGPVPFVALLAPAIAQRLAAQPVNLGLSAAIGALLLILADLAARLVLLPAEIPVGVVTGLVGAPYLGLLLVGASRRGGVA
ncbi:MAG: iron chelate uptake ABC transporter family permease subunit [Actinomycetota bacterium]